MLVAPESGIKWGIGIVIVAILTGLFAGSYPALFLSSLKPISAIKSDVVSGKSGSGLRKTLVVVEAEV